MRSIVVVGTAGHIDHGKTTLLRALTGIDADRLPEERRRGMTIDVGYAHLELDDGATIDFVDVPGHDKLVGNMLVGAGEIDAVLFVVAADDGPRAQTREHLALLDALDVGPGLAVITKTDAVEPERVAEVTAAVAELLAPTSLAGSPIIGASALSGAGLDELRAALITLSAGVAPILRPPTLAIDRVFAVRGRGAVVTGSLRGGPLVRGDDLRLLPDGRDVRVRELQVHGRTVDRVEAGGRTAVNVAGATVDQLHRGDVLTADPTVRATDRVLVAFRRPIADRARARLHAGTAAVDATVGRAGWDAIELGDGTSVGIVRLASPLALAPADRFVLRRGPGLDPVGGRVLDIEPPRGISRRRQTPERVGRLAGAMAARPHAADGPDAAVAAAAAGLDLHGATRTDLADDVRATGVDAAIAAVAPEASLTSVRASVAAALRRVVTLRRDAAAEAAAALIDDLVRKGRLVRDGDRLRSPGGAAPAPDPALDTAMDRLEAALAVSAPPPLAAAARAAACPIEGIRALERSGRIVLLEADLAYASSAYRDLAARALAMAAREPLTPAAYRDATGTSRKYVMAILEDLDRRAILRRTPAGHVAGARAPASAASTTTDR